MERDEKSQARALTDDRLREIFRELVRRLTNVEASVAEVERRLGLVDLEGLDERIGALEDADARRE